MEAQHMAGHLIRRLHQVSTRLFTQRVQAMGMDMTPVQFAALDAICANPNIDQVGVAKLIAYDRATIGEVIDRLEQKGLVSRVKSRRDGRAREVRLTEGGQATLDAVRPVVRELQADILGGLDVGERELFLALARKAMALGT